MHYLFLALASASVLLFVLTPLYAYLKYIPEKKGLAVFVKAICSMICTGFGFYGMYLLRSLTTTETTLDLLSNNYFLLIALSLCTIADVILCFNFVIGGFTFFFGHICYIIYFISLGAFDPVAIILATLICAGEILYFYKYSERLEGLKILFAGYGVTISITLALSLMLPFKLGLYGFLPALGSILVVTSDFMLARNKMIEETNVTNQIALLYYFGGQYIMAMTMFLPAAMKLD